MSGRRVAKRNKLKWTSEMNEKLLESRDKAKEMVNSENTPLKEGRRKVGYMELMHKSFLEEFPDLNYLTPQNLRDKISHVEKINKSKTSLIEAFNSIDNTNIEARGEIRNNAHININSKINYACGPLNKKELEVFNEAKALFYIICKDIGNMKNRKWTTRMNKVPEQSDIFSVNKIVYHLMTSVNSVNDDVKSRKFFKALWDVDCMLYAAVVS